MTMEVILWNKKKNREIKRDVCFGNFDNVYTYWIIQEHKKKHQPYII